MIGKPLNSVIIILLIILLPCFAFAQRSVEFYFSWGYNTEWYTRSNVHVEQPGLNNDFTFKHIRGHDHKGWDEGLFKQALSIPQYNYRIGFFFNRKKDLAFEINFDHTKFIFGDQDARIKGKLNGRQVDTSVAFNTGNGFHYYLNNGANFLLFNLVKRWHLYSSPDKKLKIDFLGKAGIGPVIPHVENGFFLNTSAGALQQQPNDPHFQLGGWNIGAEGALRATFFKCIYLEYANKLDYARYAGLKIYRGTARHAFGTYEMILNLGVTFSAGKKIK